MGMRSHQDVGRVVGEALLETEAQCGQLCQPRYLVDSDSYWDQDWDWELNGRALRYRCGDGRRELCGRMSVVLEEYKNLTGGAALTLPRFVDGWSMSGCWGKGKKKWQLKNTGYSPIPCLVVRGWERKDCE